MIRKTVKRIIKIFFAKSYFKLPSLLFLNSLNIGINEELKVSSEIERLNESGTLNDIKNISARIPVPKNAARKISRIKAIPALRNDKIE